MSAVRICAAADIECSRGCGRGECRREVQGEPIKKTGWPPGMLQDDDRGLSRWLASTPNARQEAREAATEAEVRAVMGKAGFDPQATSWSGGIEEMRHVIAAAQSPSQPLVEVQEPIGEVWVGSAHRDGFAIFWKEGHQFTDGIHKLYAAPVRVLPLTDFHRDAIWQRYCPGEDFTPAHEAFSKGIEDAHGISSSAPGGDGRTE